VVAALALALLGLGGDLSRRRGLVGSWNALGLVDILMVVVTAARIALADLHSLDALLRLPLSLLITFLVPLIIVGHVVVFYRLGLAPDLERRRI
jgi:hypothetical protein